jgi:SAM-dependent methyltransferase
MQEEEFVYTGPDNLEIMQEAANYNAFLQNLAQQHIPSKKALCLDFGAGSGTFAELLRDAGYKSIVCVELDKALAKTLKKKGFTVYSSLDDVADRSVDVIYLFNVLEHIESDHDMVKQMAQKLTKNGRVLIYVPAFQHLFSSMDKKVGHYRRYTRKMLADIIRGSGLTIKSNRYYDPMGYFATLAYKVVGNNRGDLDPKKISFFDKRLFPLNKFMEPLTGKLFGKNVFIVGEVTEGK